MFANELFKDKAALVTGGGTGIGKEIARELVSLGCKVMITGRREEKLKEAASEIDVSYQVCDIRKEDEVKSVFKATADKFGQIDFVVNNAGGQFIAPFEKISTNAFDAVVKTNLYGTWYCCKEASNYLKEGGRIINIVHIYALRCAPGLAHSGAARAGVVNLTKTLAVELASKGITVNGIAPGITQTQGFNEEMINNQKMMNMLRETIPLHRFADPAEIGNLVTFLCSPGGSFITGEVITMDGGQILANWPDFNQLDVRE